MNATKTVPNRGNAMPSAVASQRAEQNTIADSRYCRCAETFPKSSNVAQPKTVFKTLPIDRNVIARRPCNMAMLFLLYLAIAFNLVPHLVAEVADRQRREGDPRLFSKTPR